MRCSSTAFLTALSTVLISALFAPSAAWAAEEPELINRPVNTTGLTGLLKTTAPFVLDAGTVEVGVGTVSETSTKPDASSNEYFLTVTMGLGRGTELSARGTVIRVEKRDASQVSRDRGAGDGSVSFKWNFLPRKEASAAPALAMFTTAVFPTGDEAAGTNSVLHWGGRLGLAAGSEILWEDHVIALYADGSIAAQDLSDEQFRDAYHIVNTGLAFPISKNRNLQLVVEYTVVSGRDVQWADGPDYIAVTTGVRLVTERFNLSMATQFVNREPRDYDNASRIVGVMSLKF